jgi:hypothetical protein
MWLALKKVLSWENLQKRVKQAPGLCFLCRESKEDIVHLPVNYSYVMQLWSKVE